MLVKMNVLVCPLSSDSGLYHSFGSYSLLYHFKGKQTFLHPYPASTPPCQCTEMCAITQPSQTSSLQTERQINEDTEITRARGWGCWFVQIWINFNIACTK